MRKRCKIKKGDLITFRDDLKIGDRYGHLIMLAPMVSVRGGMFFVRETTDEGGFNIVGSRYTFHPFMTTKIFKYGR